MDRRRLYNTDNRGIISSCFIIQGDTMATNTNFNTQESKNNVNLMGIIVMGILILLITQSKKYTPQYHSDVYNSWQDEQIDELRADLNYLEDKLYKKVK